MKNSKKNVKFLRNLAIFTLLISALTISYLGMKKEKSLVGTVSIPQFGLMPIFAANEGDASCNAMTNDAFTACSKMMSGASAGGYEHGALKFFNETLCRMNKHFPAMAEVALCHFTKSMGMNPDKAALPQTIEKSFGAMSVKLVVSQPTETFATSLGYDAKGVVTLNGSTFMILYWGGKADSSKGFMMQGSAGFNSQKNPMYIQWDRSGDDQFVKVFGARYSNTYLGSPNSNGNGDEVLYGKANYNKTTKVVSTQTVLIGARRGASSGDTTNFGCFKMFASGTKAGTITVAKTHNSLGDNGHATTDTVKTAASDTMDAAQLTDSASTANGTGNLGSGDFGGLSISFDKSCNDLKTAGSGIFGGTEGVVFTYGPSDVFN